MTKRDGRSLHLPDELTDMHMAGTSRLGMKSLSKCEPHFEKYLKHRKALLSGLRDEGVYDDDDGVGFVFVDSDDRVDIHMYDFIDPTFGISASNFIAPLKSSTERRVPVNIHINSIGGDVWEALTMRDLLLAHGQPLNVRIQGICASAATFVALSGNEVSIMPEGSFMIHNSMAFMRGNAKELREMANECDKADQSIIQIYVGKTGRTKDEISGLMDESRTFVGDEAVEMGFCDKVEAKSKTSEVTNSLEKSKRELQLKRRNLAALAKAFTFLGGSDK